MGNDKQFVKVVNNWLKITFDFVVSIVAILVLIPIFLIISFLIKIDSKGPIIFKQVRVGKNGKEFKIYKFRTMVTDAERLGKQITVGHDPRITRVGHFLRKFKLDELPQLFNVLKGDMSFVGPRPEVPRYTQLYNEEQKKVLTVRPGITDYASIKYRNENEILAKSEDPEKTYIEVIMPDKLKLNLKYIEEQSLWLDIKIIFMTLYKIIK
ncbi:sugar transferase [Anoxybacillus flavithermus]|uniref:sugar transferase n=1 Tax=Anoxybacillus flavithermus TaxID=33934 RepID=UPI0007DFC761|nr:sugar transferase [Anoxybacillus flavithermus]OAO79479.1 sugar transferase [Anoxybacillus flavithermus]